MSSKTIFKLAHILFLCVCFSECSYYTFDVKKNTLLNTYKRNPKTIGEEWGFNIVGDSGTLGEYLDSYKEMVRSETVNKTVEDDISNRLKNFTFEKKRYLIFYMPSDTPRQPISDKYKFSATDAQGNAVGITATLFFVIQNDPEEKNDFDYCWLIQFEKPLSREYFSKDKVPVELVVTNTQYSTAKILIGF